MEYKKFRKPLPPPPSFKIKEFIFEDPWEIFNYIGWPVGRDVEYVQFYDEEKDDFIELSKAPKSFLEKYYNMNLGNKINIEIIFGKEQNKIWRNILKSEKGFTPYLFLIEVKRLYNTTLKMNDKFYNLDGKRIKDIFPGRLPVEMITFQASLFGFEKFGEYYRIVFDYY